MIPFKTKKLRLPSLLFILCLFFMTMIGGCGTGPDSEVPPGPVNNAAHLELLVSSQTLYSSGTQNVTLTAVVKDAQNRALEGEAVNFSATSGSLTVTEPITNEAGTATATLGTGGDKSNRTITITATCGGAVGTNTVTVGGTTIEISGQDAVAYNGTANYTIALKDSSGTGIANQTVTLSSLYNTLSATTFTTNTNGQAPFTFTATDAGGRTDTLTATASGAIGQKSVIVNSASDTFVFTAPAANTEVNINTNQTLTVQYLVGGAPPPQGQQVYFTASRGTITPSSTATTDASGNASVTIRHGQSGISTITATVTYGGTTSTATLQIEFIAPVPASMTLQSDPSVISTNLGASTAQQSTLTATVRDASNNLVKNQIIDFSLTIDPSNGYLTQTSAVTDSSGRATIAYVAGPTQSPTNGVSVIATIRGVTPAISATTSLTVAGTALFITIGTGYTLELPTPQTYRKNYDIIVTDSGGRAVEGATVTVRLTAVAYLKGTWQQPVDPNAKYWVTLDTLASSYVGNGRFNDSVLSGKNYCLNEDMLYWGVNDDFVLNGHLDAGEDNNSSTKLEPGTPAAVQPGISLTNSSGAATVGVTYTRNYAQWVYVRLDVTVNASGTEGSTHTTFRLPILKDDCKKEEPMPFSSPFGVGTSCNNLD